jgi:ATP-dependent helicase HrpA
MQKRHLMKRELEADPEQYPDMISSIPLHYIYDASRPDDGVTATIPLASVNQLSQDRFEWLIPGWLRDKVIALIKSLPKSLRVKFVPVPEHADKVFAALRGMGLSPMQPGNLLDALSHQLGKIAGEFIDRNAFDLASLDPWLRMNFEIVDEHGEIVKTGRDLDAIRRELGMKARESFRAQMPPGEWNRENITSWDFSDLPESVEVRRNGMTLLGYPALVDSGRTVSLRLFESAQSARESNRAGVRRLLTLQLREEVKWLSRKLPQLEEMALNYATVGNEDDLKADLVTAVAERALEDPADVRTRQQFIDRAHAAWQHLAESGHVLADLVSQILSQYQALLLELSRPAPPLLERAILDMRRQLLDLVYDGFIVQTPPEWLAQYPRFMKAIDVRLRKLLNAGLTRDEQASAEIEPLWQQYAAQREQHEKQGTVDPELEQYRWMLEELRVSLYAQELKTSIPVSTKRLEAQWAKVRHGWDHGP